MKRALILVGATAFVSACMPLRGKYEPTYNERLLAEQQKAGINTAAVTEEGSSDPAMASLWVRSAGNPYMVRNQKAQKVGDLLTILIQEESSANSSAKTDAKKDSSLDISGTAGMGQGASTQLGTLSITGATKNNFKGEGKTDRSGSIRATVQAAVENVLPNGTLFVRGRKVITVNQEDQEVEVTGFVRPDDIKINNTVLSTSLADAKIRYLGDGIVADKQKAGWAARLIDAIWPF